MAAILVGICFPLAMEGYAALKRYSQHGPAALWPTNGGWLWILALVLVLGGIFIAWRMYLASGAVQITTHGLIIQHFPHPKRQLSWKEIDGIRYWEDIAPNGHHLSYQLVINPQKGKPIRINPYCANQDLPEIATRLKARVYPRLEPGLRRRLARGQAVHFASLSISQTGIKWGQQAYAWEQVQRVEIRKGLLWIHLVGRPPWKLTVSKIPNLELLMERLKRLHPTTPEYY